MPQRASFTSQRSSKGSAISERNPSSDAGEISLGDVRVSELGSGAGADAVEAKKTTEKPNSTKSSSGKGAGFFSRKKETAPNPDAPGGGNDLAAVAKVYFSYVPLQALCLLSDPSPACELRSVPKSHPCSTRRSTVPRPPRQPSQFSPRRRQMLELGTRNLFGIRRAWRSIYSTRTAMGPSASPSSRSHPEHIRRKAAA